MREREIRERVGGASLWLQSELRGGTMDFSTVTHKQVEGKVKIRIKIISQGAGGGAALT